MENTTQYVILGLLRYGDMSGYDIKKNIAEHLGHFWQESFSQIYPTLASLEKKKWVTKEVVAQEDKPSKKVYHLASEGKSALQQWAGEATTPSLLKQEELLKVFFGQNTSRNSVVQQLQKIRQYAWDELKELQKSEQKMVSEYKDWPELTYWLMTLKYKQKQKQAELKWAEDSLQSLGE